MNGAITDRKSQNAKPPMMNINKIESLELARVDDNQLFMFALAAAKSLYHFNKDMLVKLWHLEQDILNLYTNLYVPIVTYISVHPP